MKLLAITPGGITLDLDATDCLVLADCLAYARRADAPIDFSLVEALRVALRLGAVVAALDTITDNGVPEGAMLADARRVWGPTDSGARGRSRAPEPPA